MLQHNPSTPTSMSLQLACTSPAAATSKKEQQQEKDHARSCKDLACKTCLTRARDMSLFLHDSCTILHQFLQDLAKNVQGMQAIILAATLAKSCTISWCPARLCKSRARKGTYRVHVPSKSCMQDSCKILAQSCMILQVRFCWAGCYIWGPVREKS